MVCTQRTTRSAAAHDVHEMGGNRRRRTAPIGRANRAARAACSRQRTIRNVQHATDNARYATCSMQQARAGRDGVGGRKRESSKRPHPSSLKSTSWKPSPSGGMPPPAEALRREAMRACHCRPCARCTAMRRLSRPRLARGPSPGADVEGASPVPVQMWILLGSTALSLSPDADVAGPKAEACLVRRRRRIRRVRAEHCRHHQRVALTFELHANASASFSQRMAQAQTVRSSINTSLCRAAAAKKS